MILHRVMNQAISLVLEERPLKIVDHFPHTDDGVCVGIAKGFCDVH